MARAYAPFGYTMLPDGTLTENTIEQRILKEMRRLRDKDHSLNYIAATLNKEGMTGRDGKLWSASVVDYLLKRGKVNKKRV